MPVLPMGEASIFNATVIAMDGVYAGIAAANS